MQQTIKELNYGENLRVKNTLYSMVDRYLRTFMLSEGPPQHTEDPLTQSLRQLMPGYELSIENHTYSKQTDNEQLIDIYTHKLSVAEIVRVNIDRPWTIDKTYQAERIEYLDYPVINKELNYHSKER